MNPEALARIEKTNYAIAAVLAAFGWIVLGTPYALGLTVGAVVSAVNFTVIRRLVVKRDPKSSLFLIPKMAALIAVVFVAIRYLPLSAPAFAIGFSVFLISIAIESVRFTARQ
jgi:hypothetical protein